MNNWIRKINVKTFWLACILPLGIGNAANNELTAEDLAQGFELLFDGKSVSNTKWVNYQSKNESNTDLSPDWKVFPADSSFGKTGGPRDIRSKIKYSDFELRFDFRTTGNSGMYYRSLTGLNDPQGYNYGWQTGAEFALENNKTLAPWIQNGAAYELMSAQPDSSYPYSITKWNKAKIIVNKDSVEHWMNGIKVVAFRYWDANFTAAMNGQGRGSQGARSKWKDFAEFCRVNKGDKTGYIPTGFLGIQGDHAGELYLRNVKIASLPFPSVSISKVQQKLLIQEREKLRSQIGLFQGTDGAASVYVPYTTPYELSLVNVEGRKVLETIRDHHARTIPLERERFKPGVYFLNIKVQGTAFSKVLTLQ
jgi:3-keto-disaccharide hydrolase